MAFSAAINATPRPRDMTVVDYFSWLLKCSQSKPEKKQRTRCHCCKSLKHIQKLWTYVCCSPLYAPVSIYSVSPAWFLSAIFAFYPARTECYSTPKHSDHWATITQFQKNYISSLWEIQNECCNLPASALRQDIILSPFSINLLWKLLSSPKLPPAKLYWIQVRALNTHKMLFTEYQEALNHRKSATAKNFISVDQESTGSRATHLKETNGLPQTIEATKRQKELKFT